MDDVRNDDGQAGRSAQPSDAIVGASSTPADAVLAVIAKTVTYDSRNRDADLLGEPLEELPGNSASTTLLRQVPRE